ncbi:Phospholipase ABHD3 (Abhydrolase domain-containing protein 3) [Durusdinium trenchii]|uniref:Phospholipase ABHD3 (Abhydrolase domain-containing protein 3) n=2 Tax=Durusdinium trenchii TaxID=1381693 RepID=A0ABP0SD32_9DINO
MAMAPELRGDAEAMQQLLEDEQLGAALRRPYRPHWLHLGWIASTAGATVKGIPIPRTWRDSEEKKFTLKDGGTVSLDWWQGQHTDRPVVLVLPGMANSSRSIYIRYTMARLAEAGFQAVAMNYRAVEHLEITSPHIGCADTWKDLPEVLDVIEAECPAQPIFAMGFSMGGTILTKYLGENGQQSRLRAAVAVSCPLAYPAHQAELEKRKFLSFLMAQPLKLWLFKKREQIAKLWPHCEMSQVMMSGSLLTVAGYFFEHQGYHTVSDYFLQNDPEPVLQRIACPLLILGAKDDPLMMPVPRETIAQNKHLILVETEDGGHMGWAGKGTLGPQIFGSSWADGLAARFLAFHAKMPVLRSRL